MLASMGPIRTFLRDHRALAIWLVVLALAMKALVSDSVCPYTALGHASLAGADPALLATALAFILALAFAPLAPARLSRIPHIRPPLRGPPSQARLT